jgi:hypothetical protein
MVRDDHCPGTVTASEKLRECDKTVLLIEKCASVF